MSPWLVSVSAKGSSLDFGGAGFFLGDCFAVTSFSSLYPASLTEPFFSPRLLFFSGSIFLILISCLFMGE
jgi:hypothetical protein